MKCVLQKKNCNEVLQKDSIMNHTNKKRRFYIYGDHYVRVGLKMESSRSHANNPSNAKWKGANVESYL